MSVFYCNHCDKLIDSDFVECIEVDDELVCIDCYTEIDVYDCFLCNKETTELLPDPRGIGTGVCKGCEYEIIEKISAGDYN